MQEFRPERWLPEGLGPETITNKAVLASFSFGKRFVIGTYVLGDRPDTATCIGPYYCIGKPLAYHQMRYALTRLILAFDMEFEKEFDAAAFRDGVLNMRTMFLKNELRISVRKRPGVDFEKLVY